MVKFSGEPFDGANKIDGISIPLYYRFDPTVKMENLKKIKAGDIIIYQDFMQRKFISAVVTRVSDVLPQYSSPWTISTRDTAREDGYIFEENGYAATFSCVAGVIVGWYKTGMSYEDIYV